MCVLVWHVVIIARLGIRSCVSLRCVIVIIPTCKYSLVYSINSITPLEGALVHLHHTMQEIIEECTQGGVTFVALPPHS